MHFALPPRKSSHPPPYARTSRPLPVRRKQLQIGGLIFGVILILIYFMTFRLKPSKEYIPYGTPETVVVTVLDEPTMSQTYREKIIENRKHYAEKHGYATFFPNVTDYDLSNSPRSWALVPSMRHAMTAFPHSTYFLSLSPHSLIMNPSLDLKSHVMDRKRLEQLMMRDVPVVPPDSVIRTFSHLRGDKIDLVITQDGEGLCQGSFIMRRGEWAKFFLDTWFDPLYRSYNFQKAEGHALEHVVQWHPTILTKLALVPQKTINAYNKNLPSRGGDKVVYAEGDFIVRLEGCDQDPARNCQTEFEQYYAEWKKITMKT